MRRVLSLGLLLALAWVVTPAHAFDIEKVERGIVRVLNIRDGNIAGTGTGFVVDSRHLLTNNHVVKGADRLLVASPFLSEPAAAVPVDRHRDFDVALLRMQAPTPELRPLTITTTLPAVGDSVFSVGFPGQADMTGITPDDKPTLTGGVLSRIYERPWYKGWQPITVIQHNADISKGNSGGPLVDDCSRVLGVNTQGRTSANDRGHIAHGLFWASAIKHSLVVARENGVRISPDTSSCESGAVGVAPGEAEEAERAAEKAAGKAESAAAKAQGAESKADAALEESQALKRRLLRWGGMGLIGLAVVLGIAFVIVSAMIRRQNENMRHAMMRAAEPVSRPFRRGGGRATRPVGDAAGTPADSRPQRDERARPGGPGLVLTGIGPDGRPLRITLPANDLASAGDGHCLGRHPELVDTVIADDSVSRRHARVTSDGRSFSVEDLNSTRGTMVNRSAVAPFTGTPLKAGDKLGVGGVELVVSAL